MEASAETVAARAHSWLAASIEFLAPGLWDHWWETLDEQFTGHLLWRDPWPNDYWVALGIRNNELGNVVQTWRHVGALDEWPLLDANVVAAQEGQPTSAQSLCDILAAASPLAYDHPRVLDRFMTWIAKERRGQGIRDAPSASPFKAEFVRTWMRSAIGTALTGLALSPTEDPELLGSETKHRLQAISDLHEVRGEGEELEELRTAYRVEALYTADWRDGKPWLVPTHQGQPASARDEWLWLAYDLDADQLREAIRTAAALLVSPPLLEPLVAVAAEGRQHSALALCVLRRWALGLKALAWLEQAITHSWTDVRQTDVVAFALASTGPWWPRATLAISHCSADAKAALAELRIWGVPAVAIDAMTVPAWESNTGFVWRLVAATPVLFRLRTENYAESTWCRREAELMQYLLDVSDFVTGRVVVDGELVALPRINEALASVTPAAASDGAVEPGFPPTTFALDVPSWPPLIIKLLAAVATLRLLNGLIGDPTNVNLIARALVHGSRLDLPPPTSDPSGWAMHHETFGALAVYSDGDSAPVRVAEDYPPEELATDVEAIVNRLPDLREVSCSGSDVLAALEWDREIRRWFPDHWGSQTVVDFRDIDGEAWVTDPRHGIKRGVLEFRTRNAMLFLLQRSDQGVDGWQGPAAAEVPILTQYLENQFPWLVRAHTLPTWIAAYTSLPSLEFDHRLVDAVFNSLADEFAAARGGLSVPTQYSEFFAIDRDDPFLQQARHLGVDV